tara:strand:+ start:140 stop:487 length:348 start_codon:yes stop_codon:yes gene_type:complete
MNEEQYKIDVTGIDPWQLLAALHNNSRPSPIAVCLVQARGDITPKEAKDEVLEGIREEYRTKPDGVPFWPDYLFGRPIKTYLARRDEKVVLLRTDLYDRDIGEGATARVVAQLKK